MPAVNRELEIDYGGFKVGGNTDYLLHEWTTQRQDFETARISFVVIVQKDTGFETACNDLEKAFRKPYQSLKISQDGTSLLELGPDYSFGFNAKPLSEKEGTRDADTGRSRAYRITIDYGLPADNVSPDLPDGHRKSTVHVGYTPARRRTVVISGVWTTVGATQATAKYEAEIDAYAQAVLTGLGGTYELVNESTERDEHDDVIEFSRSYEEIIFGQGKGAIDDPEIVDQSLVITRETAHPGDTPIEDQSEGPRGTTTPTDSSAPEGAADDRPYGDPNVPRGGGGSTVRPVRAIATYSCWLDATLTIKLEEKWEILKPWVIEEAKRVLSGSFALIEQSVSYDRDDNRINARLVLEGVADGALIDHRIEVSDKLDTGVRFASIMSGQPFEKYRYRGPASSTRHVVKTCTFVGRVTTAEAKRQVGSGAPSHPPDQSAVPGGTGAQSEIVNEVISATHLRRGDAEFDSVLLTEIKIETTIEFFKSARVGRSTPTTGGETPPPAPPPTTTPRIVG